MAAAASHLYGGDGWRVAGQYRVRHDGGVAQDRDHPGDEMGPSRGRHGVGMSPDTGRPDSVWDQRLDHHNDGWSQRHGRLDGGVMIQTLKMARHGSADRWLAGAEDHRDIERS